MDQRGPVAVADMKARLAAGWTVDMLWDRMIVAESGEGYSYDMAESVPKAEGCTASTTSSMVSAATT
jgi:hypothetical protein